MLSDDDPGDPDNFMKANSTVIGANIGSSPYIMIIFTGQTTGTYDVATGNATVMYTDTGGQMYAAMIIIGSGTVTVTSYGAVGETIVGTFDVVADIFAGENPSGTTTNATGSFTVTRGADTP